MTEGQGGRHAWIDASAGVAGDMLLGALLDAGASEEAVRSAIDAVAGGGVRLRVREVTRAGLRALKADIEVVDAEPPERHWREVRDLVERAGLPGAVERDAIAVFARLAGAEARVHGIEPDEVHFHEVGALDAIADVVGCCAALADLGIVTVSASPVALGSGSVRSRHGRLPVPAPAVAELARGWQVSGTGDGELATPTGMALLRTLADRCEPLPPMTLEAVGVGAGTRDPAGRANVVRVLVGVDGEHESERLVLLEANVDDLDPRLWPGVLQGLLELGAADAWLTPIVMKKGRPAHTLSVLCRDTLAPTMRERIFRDTSTLGIRHSARGRVALDRSFAEVAVGSGRVSVKLGHRDGVLVQVMPEFEDVAALARREGRPERLVLQEAQAAAAAAGLVVGEPVSRS
ncbi:nickel pincer cofactor biosynthesis protein LarC [Paractinoplanes globisporus]|uniref:Pyridinium-3,5-bisthiocarboxylic acid mononucleotide nickel insertion protein n=1 Tax=Paractinoplanes globisporus TaxID=113565 RepID=A0ABW6WV93_9ACTN|nr:nickel pincer cofactor biosynthesis protein LarC [Actinoplanes globisporus]